MKGVIHRRARARQDLIAIFRRYARQAGMGVGRRFRAEAEATFNRLATMPGMGTKYDADNPAFGELRYFPLSAGFQIYLVFYRPWGLSGRSSMPTVRAMSGVMAVTSLRVEFPGSLRYSWLSRDGLSNATRNAASAASSFSRSIGRRASWSRNRSRYRSGLRAANRMKCS